MEGKGLWSEFLNRLKDNGLIVKFMTLSFVK